MCGVPAVWLSGGGHYVWGTGSVVVKGYGCYDWGYRQYGCPIVPELWLSDRTAIMVVRSYRQYDFPVVPEL